MRRLSGIGSAMMISSLLLFTATANAQNWKIELYTDAQMSSCSFTYSGPQLFQVHVFHTGTGPAEASAVSFALYSPPCMTGAIYAGEHFDVNFTLLQNSQDTRGISIGYGTCIPLPVYLGYVDYYAFSEGEGCCDLRAVDPTHQLFDLMGATCDFQGVAMESSRTIINPTANCPCESPVATRSTTWGRVKALYR